VCRLGFNTKFNCQINFYTKSICHIYSTSNLFLKSFMAQTKSLGLTIYTTTCRLGYGMFVAMLLRQSCGKVTAKVRQRCGKSAANLRQKRGTKAAKLRQKCGTSAAKTRQSCGTVAAMLVCGDTKCYR
jgi:hypothetical protein